MLKRCSDLFIYYWLDLIDLQLVDCSCCFVCLVVISLICMFGVWCLDVGFLVFWLAYIWLFWFDWFWFGSYYLLVCLRDVVCFVICVVTWLPFCWLLVYVVVCFVRMLGWVLCFGLVVDVFVFVMSCLLWACFGLIKLVWLWVIVCMRGYLIWVVDLCVIVWLFDCCLTLFIVTLCWLAFWLSGFGWVLPV